MNKMITYIKFGGLISLVVFLFAFSSDRNGKRKIDEVAIEFIEEQNPFINELTVNKLLIQNQVGVTNVGKEILALNNVEKGLDSHSMIEDSDVYLTVSGQLKARIKQRTPIARVNSIVPFYVDVMGNTMPLSGNYSAHVPLVNNVSEREVTEIYPLLKMIQEDEFLKRLVVNLYKNIEGNYELGLRVYDFKVDFGKIENIHNKVRNFKAFYQKALKDQSFGKYTKVSLQYSNQVVCTIK